MPLDPKIRDSFSRLDDKAANVPFANPITEARADQVLGEFSLAADDTVLDVGARRCELLIRLVERYGCWAVGIDNVQGFATIASERARGRIPPERLEAHETTAAEHFARHPSDAYTSAICVGSSHAFGDYGNMLKGLMWRTRAGSLLFVGYPFRKAKPGSIGHDAHIALARQLGLDVVVDWEATG